MSDTISGAPLSVSSGIGPALMQILTADDILPGSEPSYQLCKLIYLYHPLGAKMTEAPINLAQSQAREISVEDAPDRVAEAFKKEWKAIRADKVIHNVTKQSRIYGIASVVLGVEGKDGSQPLQPETLATDSIYFNVLDPLNTAGSLVLDQNTNSPQYQKTTQITTDGETYHRSRVCIMMNEEPIYIAYTTSAFGFVGRSVYQRVLFPLKSFIQCMITDDMISRKAGLLVAKMQSPGSIINRAMTSLFAAKRQMLHEGRTDNVLSVGIEEDVASINLQNIDGAGTFARTNILKNIATGADMPAMLLENETLTEGFGEGSEDAKQIARYIDRFRETMEPAYDFMDNIVQHRAWNQEFYKQVQQQYPQEYGDTKYEAALSQWQNSFKATWPNLLEEPDSEKVQVDDIRLKAALATYQLLAQSMDPENKARLTDWLIDAVNQSDLLFNSVLSLDTEAMMEHAEQQEAQQEAMMAQGGMMGGPGQGQGQGGPPGQGGGGPGGQGKSMAGAGKMPSFKLAS
jgi:hypothetical protein